MKDGIALAARPVDNAEKVCDLFDAKSLTWSDKYSSCGRLADRLAQISGALEHYAQADSRILDLGCGTGDIARAMASSGMQVIGCDISREMLRQAARIEAGADVRWVHLDIGWRELPFPDASFDAVIAASILEYVAVPNSVLAECARVLRPSGVLLCTVPDIASPVRWAECLLSISARVPGSSALALLWPKFGHYVAYLQLSQQRHFCGWWTKVAKSCRLQKVASSGRGLRHAPLCLLIFQRMGSSVEV